MRNNKDIKRMREKRRAQQDRIKKGIRSESVDYTHKPLHYVKLMYLVCIVVLISLAVIQGFQTSGSIISGWEGLYAFIIVIELAIVVFFIIKFVSRQS